MTPHPGRCPITGDANITRDDHGQPRWERADPAIHISGELLAQLDHDGHTFLVERYSIGEQCLHQPDTRHARLRDHTRPAVRITSHGPTGTIEIDGHDISGGVTGFTLHHQVGGIGLLELDLAAVPLDYHGQPATQVHLPPQARELLISHGWTPPDQSREILGYLVRGEAHPHAPEDITVMYRTEQP